MPRPSTSSRRRRPVRLGDALTGVGADRLRGAARPRRDRRHGRRHRRQPRQRSRPARRRPAARPRQRPPRAEPRRPDDGGAPRGHRPPMARRCASRCSRSCPSAASSAPPTSWTPRRSRTPSATATGSALIEALCAAVHGRRRQRADGAHVRPRRGAGRRRAAGPPRRRVRRHGRVVPSVDQLRRPRAPAPGAAGPGRRGRSTTAGRRCSWTSARATPQQVNVVTAHPASPPTSGPPG